MKLLLAQLIPVWMQHSSSMTAGTLTLTVPCMPAPAAGMGCMQQGNKSMQSAALEAAVPVWGSALPSPASTVLPFCGTVLWQPVGSGPCAGPQGKAGLLQGWKRDLTSF